LVAGSKRMEALTEHLRSRDIETGFSRDSDQDGPPRARPAARGHDSAIPSTRPPPVNRNSDLNHLNARSAEARASTSSPSAATLTHVVDDRTNAVASGPVDPSALAPSNPHNNRSHDVPVRSTIVYQGHPWFHPHGPTRAYTRRTSAFCFSVMFLIFIGIIVFAFIQMTGQDEAGRDCATDSDCLSTMYCTDFTSICIPKHTNRFPCTRDAMCIDKCIAGACSDGSGQDEAMPCSTDLDCETYSCDTFLGRCNEASYFPGN
jgi:hypothetical protein